MQSWLQLQNDKQEIEATAHFHFEHFQVVHPHVRVSTLGLTGFVFVFKIGLKTPFTISQPHSVDDSNSTFSRH